MASNRRPTIGTLVNIVRGVRNLQTALTHHTPRESGEQARRLPRPYVWRWKRIHPLAVACRRTQLNRCESPPDHSFLTVPKENRPQSFCESDRSGTQSAFPVDSHANSHSTAGGNRPQPCLASVSLLDSARKIRYSIVFHGGRPPPLCLLQCRSRHLPPVSSPCSPP